MNAELKPSKERFENAMRPCLSHLRLTKSFYSDSYVLEEDNKLWRAYEAGHAELEAEVIKLREQQRWIPVGERLPNRDSVHDVIVRSTDSPTFQRRAVAVLLNGEFSVTKHASCEYVSHWKALPEMPEFTAGDQQ